MKGLVKGFWVPVIFASLIFSYSESGKSAREWISNVRPPSGTAYALASAPSSSPTPFNGTGSISPAGDAGVGQNVFVELSQRTVPSVVNIFTRSRPKRPAHPSFRGRPLTPEDMFRRFFEGGPSERMQPESGPPSVSLGTGFVIDGSGIIATNHHVIDGADEVKVKFTESPSEKPTDAEIIGRDPELDVALLRVKTDRPLQALELGDSDALNVGEYVMAVGNPFGQGHSVTHGIVSAKGRANPFSAIGSYIQTDAPINPGNSGGPLLNLRGQVIGINTAIDARAQGIGFAIPVNLVKAVLPQLKSKGSVSRGYIGVGIEDLNSEIASKLEVSKDLAAAFVADVGRGSPAEIAGLKSYDVITEIDGRKISSASELVAAVTATPPGTRVAFSVLRGGKKQQISVRIGERPSGSRQQMSPVPPMGPEETEE